MVHRIFLNLRDELGLTGTSSSIRHGSSATGHQELSLKLEESLHHLGLVVHLGADGSRVAKVPQQVVGNDLIVGKHHGGLRLQNIQSI